MCWLAWESTHSPAELALPVPWACILLCHGDRVAAASHLTFCLFVCVAETKGSLQRRASGAEPRRSPTRRDRRRQTLTPPGQRAGGGRGGRASLTMEGLIEMHGNLEDVSQTLC